jgi:hypothetical protein
MTIIMSNNSMIIIIIMLHELSQWRLLIYLLTYNHTNLTYDNKNLTKNDESMHNRIMLTLKILLELITTEAYMKDC